MVNTVNYAFFFRTTKKSGKSVEPFAIFRRIIAKKKTLCFFQSSKLLRIYYRSEFIMIEVYRLYCKYKGQSVKKRYLLH